ncbi:unnamed protein product [Fusarium langsethiae]|nr:unnamed protein product [Fusarium langsethiae]
MAPSTPARPSTAPRGQQPPQATPPENYPTLEEELEIPMDTDGEEGEEIVPAYPYVREDEGKIESLENKVNEIANLAEKLGIEAKNSQRLYKEHIEHTAALAATGKDPGEILRPRQPDPYDGNPEQLQGFLTALCSYQMYYPIQFSTDEMRTRHAISLLKSRAQRLMEPIVRDYVNNPPYKCKEMTKWVYENYENFEEELTYAFGLANERREAESKIRALRQTGSAASYLSEYLYLGLKDKVKDALVNIRPKPKDLTELANIVVEIDTQQYERRREKQAAKNGIQYKPNWNKQDSKNRANQGKIRQVDTSYGTHPGPMSIATTKFDKSKLTCWNCGKKGHCEPECRNPVKTNQKYRPVPEVTRKGKEIAPDTEDQLTPDEDANKEIDSIPTKVTIRRPNKHYGDPNYRAARRLHEEQQQDKLAKELQRGRLNRRKITKYLELTKKRAETVQDNDIYIWATTREGLQDPEILNDPIIDPQDKRRYATNENHKNLSWISCTAHHCALHLGEKDYNDCFPRPLKVYEYQKPYLIIDTIGY